MATSVFPSPKALLSCSPFSRHPPTQENVSKCHLLIDLPAKWTWWLTVGVEFVRQKMFECVVLLKEQILTSAGTPETHSFVTSGALSYIVTQLLPLFWIVGFGF